MAGLLGHGDSFVLRDPAGIRPAYYYDDDEVVVVASERPAIQTVFNIPFEAIQELPPGNAIITKNKAVLQLEKSLPPSQKSLFFRADLFFQR